MARGGKRVGSPGKNYQNRTDLHQPIRVAPDQQYGQAQALENAQRVIPLPTQSSAPAQAAPASSPAPAGAGPTSGPFTRPTDRPNEPVTAGLPTGPGPGPEILTSGAGPNDTVRQTLQALYNQNPN